MASTYPDSLDDLATDKVDGTAMATDHAAHHDDMADAINNIQAALGTNPFAACIVNRAAVQTIPTGVVTPIAWDYERTDTPGWFSLGSPTFIQVNQAGVYLVTVQTGWENNSTGVRSAHLQLGGTTTSFASDGAVLAGNATGTAKWENPYSLTWAGPLANGAKLAVFVWQTSGGGSLNFGGLSRPAATSANAEFGVVRLGV